MRADLPVHTSSLYCLGPVRQIPYGVYGRVYMITQRTFYFFIMSMIKVRNGNIIVLYIVYYIENMKILPYIWVDKSICILLCGLKYFCPARKACLTNVLALVGVSW